MYRITFHTRNTDVNDAWRKRYLSHRYITKGTKVVLKDRNRLERHYEVLDIICSADEDSQPYYKLISADEASSIEASEKQSFWVESLWFFYRDATICYEGDEKWLPATFVSKNQNIEKRSLCLVNLETREFKNVDEMSCNYENNYLIFDKVTYNVVPKHALDSDMLFWYDE